MSPRSARAGRLALSGAFLLVVSLLASYGALRFCAARPPAPPAEEPGDGAADREEVVSILRGSMELEAGVHLEASVAPLHASRELEAFRSRALRGLLGLPDGELFLIRVHCAEGTDFDAARVLDERGEAIVPLAADLEGAPRSGSAEPWRALLALESSRNEVVVGWGRFPAEGARLELLVGDRLLSLALEPGQAQADELEEWLARSGAPVEEPSSPADARVTELEAELEAERARRQASELRLLEFQRLVARLETGAAGALAGRADVPDAGAEEPVLEPDPAVVAARARAAEIARSLSALFKVEGLRGVDLLEIGTLGDGFVGPVAFRLLDDRGRLVGGLFAERLRLEASRSAKMVTVVLEDGCESAGETRTPFEGGVRRMPLVHVDPQAWFEATPELFAADVLAPPNDDGLWDHARLRSELNRLLGLDGSTGFFRVHSFGGVLGSELVDVHLEEFDSKGALARRFFADRLRIALDPPGVSLWLEDGAVVVGDAKEPFRNGAYRIYLPRVPIREWQVARVPGLSRAATPAEGESDPR